MSDTRAPTPCPYKIRYKIGSWTVKYRVIYNNLTVTFTILPFEVDSRHIFYLTFPLPVIISRFSLGHHLTTITLTLFTHSSHLGCLIVFEVIFNLCNLLFFPSFLLVSRIWTINLLTVVGFVFVFSTVVYI